MRSIRLGFWAAVLACALGVGHARAADPVFPTASRIGIAPPAGMVASKAFPGFEDAERRAVLSLVELPLPAYAELDRGFGPEALKAQGVTLDLREEVTLAHGPGFIIAARLKASPDAVRRWSLITRSGNSTAVVTLQFAEAAAASFPDESIRRALLSTVIRDRVPNEELLSVLPYKLTRLAGFRLARVAPGGLAMMTDGPKDDVELAEQSLFIVGLGSDTPEPGERDRYARRVLATTPGVKEIRIQRAEPLRISQMQGFEMIAEAKDEKTGTPLTIVQWLRFGAGGNVRMLGITRTAAWSSVFPKLRELRDGFEPR